MADDPTRSWVDFDLFCKDHPVDAGTDLVAELEQLQQWNDRLTEEGAVPGGVLDWLSVPVTLAGGAILLLAPPAAALFGTVVTVSGCGLALRDFDAFTHSQDRAWVRRRSLSLLKARRAALRTEMDRREADLAGGGGDGPPGG